MIKAEKIIKTSCILAFLFISGCSSDNFFGSFLGHSFGLINFDRNQMLEDIQANIITPQLAALKTDTDNLNKKIQSFISEANQANLQEAQKAFNTAVISWEKVQVFNFGPVKDQRLIAKIDFSPRRTEDIEAVIKDTAVLSESSLDSFGATKKGFPVLEYLLFSSDILKSTETKRREYLKFLSEDLLKNINLYNDGWESYYDAFGKDADSLNMLLNQMIVVAEDIKDQKIAEPAGIRSGGEPKPESVESPESDNSLKNILANLQGLNQAFNGISANGKNNSGIDDYLIFLENPGLKNSINQQIDAAIKAVKDIPEPLEVSVKDNKAKVENAYQQANQLLKLLKVDLAASINETVSLTTNDGD